jgi:transaldolase
MKIFLDTAELDEIKLADSWGVIDGVTTNPSLIKKAVETRKSLTIEDYIREIVQTVSGPVSLEVIALSAHEMLNQAQLLYDKFSSFGDVTIKIPINPSTRQDVGDFEGIQVIQELAEVGIPINVTLVMTPEQALLAAKAGATYVSPFVGRIDDYIRTNLGLMRGTDFQKTDYYEASLVSEILESKILSSITEETSISPSFIRTIHQESQKGNDNGIWSGIDLVQKILTIYEQYDYSTEVIGASIRNIQQVRELAEIGTHIATIPFALVQAMIQHPKTREGILGFTADIVPEYEQLFE